MTSERTTRWVELVGAHNVRDLGGLPTIDGRVTKYGVMFRSDALDGLGAADVEELHVRSGLRHVIDLRSGRERAERGRGRLGDVPGVRYTETEMIPDDALGRRRGDRRLALERRDPAEAIMSAGYLEMLHLGEPALRTALTAICAPGGTPALVHCAAGKDRTGVLAALLLELVGVERDAIVDDYALTGERLEPIIQRLSGVAGHADLAELEADGASFELRAEPATMTMFLSRLDERYGGAAAYVMSIGIADADIARLRTLLVD